MPRLPWLPLLIALPDRPEMLFFHLSSGQSTTKAREEIFECMATTDTGTTGALSIRAVISLLPS